MKSLTPSHHITILIHLFYLLLHFIAIHCSTIPYCGGKNHIMPYYSLSINHGREKNPCSLDVIQVPPLIVLLLAPPATYLCAGLIVLLLDVEHVITAVHAPHTAGLRVETQPLRLLAGLVRGQVKGAA